MAEPQQQRVEAAVCEHLQRQGLGAQLFSDITVCFQGREYRLHRIILCQSSYFRSLLAGPWRESGKPRVDLRIDDASVTPGGLDAALAFLYGAPPALSSAAAASAALAAAAFLCIDSLAAACLRFMLADVRADTFLAYHALAHHHCCAAPLRDATWAFAAASAASPDLRPLLPRLPLQYLCRLLKSDELWILSESERYKLAKQALLEWKLARVKASSSVSDAKKLRVIKSFSRRAARTNAIAAAASKSNGKGGQNKATSKDKAKAKKDAAAAAAEKQQLREEAVESPLKRLRRLWEEDPGDESEVFEIVADLFTGGGIIYTYMDPADALQARKELEEAGMPVDVVNDAVWQNVLLKSRILQEGDKSYAASSSTEDDDDDDDEDEEEDDDDDLPISDDSSDWESATSSDDDDEDQNNNNNNNNDNNNNNNNNDNNDSNEAVVAGASEGDNSPGAAGVKRTSSEMVSFNEGEEEAFDGKRRKTSGGFSWSAKLESTMVMTDFPPFRFGAEFSFVNKAWVDVGPSTGTGVFYGGSRWKIVVSGIGKEWIVAVECRRGSYGGGKGGNAYEDWRKKVVFYAKLYVRTSNGLLCVKGSGQRTSKSGPVLESSKYHVGVVLSGKDVAKDKTLRVVAVVQLE